MTLNKRSLALTISLGATVAVTGCGSPAPNGSANGTADNINNAASSSRPTGTTNVTPSDLPPVTAAHSGGGGSQTAPMPPATAGGATKPGMDTAALDAKIEKAEAKAKGKSATPADKHAAAAAYVERGNVYYNAQTPALYKFALGDFRRALRYQPDNEDARAKSNILVGIYNDMNRPVPENGNEP